MNFSQKLAADRQAVFEAGLYIGRQQSIDMMQLVLQSKHGFAEKRMWELLMEMKELIEEFDPAFDTKHPECDYYRERLDRALSQNCGKDHPLIPFDERYEYLKKVNYGRKKK